MPVPINRIYDSGKEIPGLTMDYSFLMNAPVLNKKTVIASNKDADLLFEIWTKGERKDQSDIISLNESLGVNKKDIMRLKTMGFISTSGDGKVEFTKKGKIVITTMALGEVSTFEKNIEPKKYTDILAGMNKRNKPGYRIPKFATNNNNNLRLS